MVVGSPRSKITSSGCGSVVTLNPAAAFSSLALGLTLVTEILAGILAGVTGELGSDVESSSSVPLEIFIVGIVIKPL